MFDIKILKKELEQNNFQIHFYPQYEAASSSIIGAEAFASYHYRNIRLDYRDFSRELEAKELTGLLDLWVLEQVCQLQTRLLDKQHFVLPVIIRMSARTLCNPYHVYDFVLTLKKYDLPKGCIQAVLTSSAPFELSYGFKKGISFLQHQGVKIMINDFGADFDSFYDLKLAAPFNRPYAQEDFYSALLSQEEFYKVQRNWAYEKHLDARVWV